MFRKIMQVFGLISLVLQLQPLHAQDVDSLRHPKDSAMPMPVNPYLFFSLAEKINAPSKVKLITRTNKSMTFQQFLSTLNTDTDPGYSAVDHGLADLDKDGKKELLVSNFTGGAHCCDEIYIFKNTAPGKFQHAAMLFAGNAVITDSNTIVYDFHEQFGYFFTCFACGYSDTSDAAAVPLHNIQLRYSKGKLVVVPGDKEMRSTINDNLAKLGELPYEKLDDDLAQDEGTRKELAMNLAVFYYSFGKNLVSTRALFNKYYRHPDAQKVWNAFARQIQSIAKQNDF